MYLAESAPVERQARAAVARVAVAQAVVAQAATLRFLDREAAA